MSDARNTESLKYYFVKQCKLSYYNLYYYIIIDQLQYYCHCYGEFWQYYAKYAYHAEKLSHSNSCFPERELPLM